MTSRKNTRERTIRFKKPSTDDDVTRIKAALTGLTPLIKTEIYNDQLHVSYEFPQLTITKVWETIQSEIGGLELGGFEKLKMMVMTYMEENERDHLCLPLSWQTSTKHIYAYYYDKRHSNRYDRHKKTWQKYGK